MREIVLAHVPSSRKGGPLYEIASGAAFGSVVCDCPSFTVGRRLGTPCKHIRLYEHAQAVTTQCHLADHGVRGLCLDCLIVLLVDVQRRRVTWEREAKRAWHAREREKKDARKRRA